MLYKRNKTWWVRFTTPNGKQIRRSAGTSNKTQAQQFLDELKASFWKVEVLGERPAYIWEDAVIKWLKENEDKPSVDIDRRIFRWLDLRHTWASWYVQSGTPLHVLQELGGWESVEMVRRYAHFGTQHLAQHAGNVSIFSTNLAHSKN